MKLSKTKKHLVEIYNKWYDFKLRLKDSKLKKIIGIPKLMTIDETIEYINNNHCSVCRYGDGELKIATGLDIKFQKYDKKLADRLREILKSNSKKCLVCLTDTFDDISWMNSSAYNYTWRIIQQNRKIWTDMLDMNYNYGNAFISRFYMDRKDKSDAERLFNKVKTIWADKDIVFIEGAESRLGMNNDLFSNAKSIKRILCPSKDAFSYYENILKEALKLHKDSFILIALGPTATILAYDLSLNGYQALDIGHIDIEYEWFLMKATKKVKVGGKYTSEAKNGDLVDDNNIDKDYENEIIAKIGC